MSADTEALIERHARLGPWCGHGVVDLRTWSCPDCGQIAPPQTRERLERQETKAPPGYIWILTSRAQDLPGTEEDNWAGGGPADGAFTDRARIPHCYVRGFYDSAKGIRARLRAIHWYQGFYNPDLFEGWEEEDQDDINRARSYHLSLYKIDGAG